MNLLTAYCGIRRSSEIAFRPGLEHSFQEQLLKPHLSHLLPGEQFQQNFSLLETQCGLSRERWRQRQREEERYRGRGRDTPRAPPISAPRSDLRQPHPIGKDKITGHLYPPTVAVEREVPCTEVPMRHVQVTD